MSQIYVDSNVFLRFFTSDDEGQHEKAARLFEKEASGKFRLVTGPPVLFEIAWTLRSAYSLSAEKTLDVVSRILSMPGLCLTDAEIVGSALALARASGTEFADAYIAASVKRAGAETLATFNTKHFQKLDVQLHKL